MEKIRNQSHSVETFYYNIARLLERASYYGMRALIVLYMTDEVLQMDTSSALIIYGWFAGSVVFSQLLGAVLGDLLIGNKKSILIGGILQALGAFLLCIPSTNGLYGGLFFIVLGNGFFTPNIIANYGKSYLNKTKLLDAAFSIFYLAINLGSFIGILLIGYFGREYSYNTGFVVCGLLTLIALVPILKTKENEQLIENKSSISKRFITIILAFIIVGLFWGVYEISNYRIFDLQLKFTEISALNFSASVWQSLSTGLTLPMSLIAVILWTHFYNSQFFKLLTGFIFGVFALSVLLYIPEVPEDKHTYYFIASLLLLAISEIHIAPIIDSILTKYANPKYLAILISLAFLPIKLFALCFGLFNEQFSDNPTLAIKAGIAIMLIVLIVIITYMVIDKKVFENHNS